MSSETYRENTGKVVFWGLVVCAVLGAIVYAIG